MTHPAADHFAQTLLDTHGLGATFTIELPGDEDGGEVATAFERLGCTVEPSPFELALRITAPRIAA